MEKTQVVEKKGSNNKGLLILIFLVGIVIAGLLVGNLVILARLLSAMNTANDRLQQTASIPSILTKASDTMYKTIDAIGDDVRYISNQFLKPSIPVKVVTY